MLQQRVFTAIVLLAILLPAVFYPEPWAFACVAGVLVCAATWEWGRLNQSKPGVAYGLGVLMALLCTLLWRSDYLAAPLPLHWLTTGAAWVALCVWLLSSGVARWASVPRLLRVWGGVAALLMAFAAVVQARVWGVNFLFSVLSICWVADISAYFAGRAWGGRWIQRKLAPNISPGKTWEGALGGVLGVLVCAAVWVYADHGWSAVQPSVYSRLYALHPALMLLGVVFLCSMSVVGDLAESLFKRSAGVKDSSQLLPGHGGVLDRIDALLPVLPLAMMLCSV